MPGIQTTQAGNGPGGMTNLTAAIAATSTTVTLANPCVVVTITNNSSSAVINIVLSGTAATATNYAINPLQSYTYNGPPITAVSIIGTASSGNYSILSY